ncbi:uncharacterized protein ACNLHF_016714 [Anomaloglossus baeobatrachus]
MDSVFPSQDNLGSMVLLTNKTTISNKLLSLASPTPRRRWISRNIKITVPSIVVQVLLAVSTTAIVLFTASFFLKMEQTMVDLNSGCTYQKHPSMKHIVQAVRSQKFHLQALAAFILVNSYLFLQLSQLSPLYLDKTSDNDTVQLEWDRQERNMSESEIGVLPLPSIKILPFMAFCVNFAVPLVSYTMKESEPVWQKQHFWGLYYSVILLLATLKYLSSAITFYVICLKAQQSPQILIFQDVTTWLSPLYASSVLSLFLYLFFLKIYMEMRFTMTASGSPASNLTLRRKVHISPSPLGVIVTTFLVIGSEVPFLLHLVHFVLLYRREICIVYLLVFNSGFCFLNFCGCLMLGLRRKHHAKKCRGKQKQIDSGICLAASFIYQSGPETANKRSEKC